MIGYPELVERISNPFSFTLLLTWPRRPAPYKTRAAAKWFAKNQKVHATEETMRGQGDTLS
jgi:hypothetical protein